MNNGEYKSNCKIEEQALKEMTNMYLDAMSRMREREREIKLLEEKQKVLLKAKEKNKRR